MLRIMLCGAADTERIRDQFSDVVLNFGGEPWHFLSGRILHVNAAQGSWQRNSALTVRKADLCVFVIVEGYGEITWTTELRAALTAGKPFLIMCLESTYQKYLTLTRAITDRSAIADAGDQRLVAIISELESEQRQSTITPFRYGYFREALRHQLAALFMVLLGDQEKRNRHTAAAQVFGDPNNLTASDIEAAVELALDETEDKAIRKRAIRALAARGAVEEDAVRELLASSEQGIQRLAVQLLAEFFTGRIPDTEFFEYCVSIVNDSDDVGLARRLIPALLKIDLATAIGTLALLDTTEIGTRRRLAEALGATEEEIVRLDLSAQAVDLLHRCLQDSREAGWRARCRELVARLTAE